MSDRPAWLDVLAPPAAARLRSLSAVVERLHLFLETRPSLAVAPPVDQAALRQALACEDFRGPRPLLELVSAVAVALEHGIVHTGHPRYFGGGNPPSGFPGQVAALIAAVVNPQLATWSDAAVPVEIERRMIQEIGTVLGVPEPMSGHFTAGEAEANATALLLAVHRSEPRFAAEGARGCAGRPLVYASTESHPSWAKTVHQCGLGCDALRLVGTDNAGVMDVARLAQAIAADRQAGHLPVMIVGTAGTASAGMIDPLGVLAELARQERLHYHVDAAYGGAAAFSPTLNPYLEGLGQSDSVTVAADQWLPTPMGASMLVCRDSAGLYPTFAATGFGAEDPCAGSLQWSRRFIGLALYLTLGALGREGMAAMVDRMTGLGHVLRAGLKERGWTVRNPTPLPVVCFTGGRTDDPVAVAARLQRSGAAWLSATRYVGRPVLRAGIGSFETSEDDIRQMIDALEAARR
jgi:glutamate/tyrosine decarboxylase-like PLP-dependent enzyme